MKHLFKSTYTMVFIGLLATACKKETPLVPDQTPVPIGAFSALTPPPKTNPNKTSPASPKTPKNPIKITTPGAPKPSNPNTSRINPNMVPKNLFNTGGQNLNNSNKYASKDYIDKNYDSHHNNGRYSDDY